MKTIQEMKLIASAPLAPGAETQRVVIGVQVARLEKKTTKGGKPYYEIGLADGMGEVSLKVWDNAPAFRFCQTLKGGEIIACDGKWQSGEYGIEGEWTGRVLGAAEIEQVLAGSPERAELLERSWASIVNLASEITRRPLKLVVDAFLQKFGPRFRRAAAARGNHHARRGGLVEHTALMMESAAAICTVYKDIDRDMLLAGALLHDLGKMWENQYENDFVMPFTARVELFGHIAIGVELVRGLWKELRPADAPAEEELCIDLLCHCILAHHGELEWGSPVTPKTMEAQLLHFLDNIDAKLEMMRGAFATENEIGSHVIKAPWPLKWNLVRASSL